MAKSQTSKIFKCAVCEKFKDSVHIDNVVAYKTPNYFGCVSYVEIICPKNCCYKLYCKKCSTIALYLHNEYYEIIWEHDGRI